MTVEEYFDTMRFDENLNSNCECYNDTCVKRVLEFYDFDKVVKIKVCNMHYRLCIENHKNNTYDGYYDYCPDNNTIAKHLTKMIGKKLVMEKYNIEILEDRGYRVKDLSDITICHELSSKPMTWCRFNLIDIVKFMIDNDCEDYWRIRYHLNREIKNELKNYLNDTKIGFKKYTAARAKVQAAINRLEIYKDYENNLLEILIELFNLNIKTVNDEINN
jgi:hypothetical protein